MKYGRLLGTALLGLAVMLVLLAQGQVVHAAPITVNTTDDELNADGDCSLREAIQAANTDTAVDACSAGSGADTITVAAGTYTLRIAGAGENANATGDLDITDDLTISGAGAATTIIDGAALDRVLHILPGTTVEMSELTVRNGSRSASSSDHRGGGIFNDGTLTLTNSTVSGNTASFGGGVLNDFGATLTLNDSRVSGNTTGGALGGTGGGIVNFGTLTLNTSSISGNTADYAGGGVFNGFVATMALNSSTVSGNTAGRGGGGVRNGGRLTVNSSTVSDNTAGFVGGGIESFAGGIATLKNTIVANNNNLAGSDCSGRITSAGHNLIEDTSDCTITGDATGNIMV